MHVAAADQVSRRAFADLGSRLGMDWPDPPEEERARRGRARILHLIETDPNGAWGAFAGDEIVGLSLAILRDGLWGLSLLVVDPPHQSSGVGRQLLTRALGYCGGCRGGMIVSSADPRALRAYATSGFAVHPFALALGRPHRERIPAGLDVDADGEPDLELVDAIDRRIRGASHRPDLPAILDAGGRFLKVAGEQGRGYAIVDNGPKLLAATTPEVAQRLLWTALALSVDDAITLVGHLDARQQWAFPVVLEAGLELMPHLGALMLRGDVGELAPYLAHGAYL